MVVVTVFVVVAPLTAPVEVFFAGVNGTPPFVVAPVYVLSVIAGLELDFGVDVGIGVARASGVVEGVGFKPLTKELMLRKA